MEEGGMDEWRYGDLNKFTTTQGMHVYCSGI